MRLTSTMFGIGIAIILSCGYSTRMKDICSDWDKVSSPYHPKDSILNALQSNYKILLYSNLHDGNGYNDQYYFIGNNKGRWYKIIYRYTSHATEVGKPKPIIYSTESIAKNLGDSILSVFTSNVFCSIQNTNEGCDPSEYKSDVRCSAGSKPETALGIIYEKRFVEKVYNNPELFDNNCCPGNKNRQVFIKCKKALRVATGSPNL